MSMEVVVDQNLWTQIELQYEFYHEKNTHSYPFEDGILNKVIFHDYFADQRDINIKQNTPETKLSRDRTD